MIPSSLLSLAQTQPQNSVVGTVYQSILDGGWMMFPIGLCSIVALAFFVERSMALGKRRLVPKTFAKDLEQAMDQSHESALQVCEKTKVPAGRILGAGLRRWGDARPEIEKAVEDAGRREVAKLSGNLKPLVVIAAVAPLLGLLGTVLGMIKAFGVIAVEKGIGKPELLADGISQALVTTAAGLIVAIPAQIAYFYLKAKIDRFIRIVEGLYQDLLGASLDKMRKAA